MILVRILIVVMAILLFFASFTLNRKTKINGEDQNNQELPDNCLNCANKTCLSGLEQYKKDRDARNKIINECQGEKQSEE